MNKKEQLRALLDRLDEDQVEDALSYVSGLVNGPSAEDLSSEDLTAIRRGIEDIREGRFLTLEEYEQGKRL